MHTPVKILFNNNYHVELIDASTGKIKQQGDFHNLTTNTLGWPLVGVQPDTGKQGANGDFGLLHTISVGNGTATPKPSDANLTSPLWEASATLGAFKWLDEHTASQTASVTFPANSSYVGTVTEVGTWSCYCTNSGRYKQSVVTKSLLTDSEGQQITFEKTDTDILTVTVTFELSIVSANDSFEIFKHPYYSYHKLRQGSQYGSVGFDTYGYVNLCRFYYTLDNYDGTSQGTTIEQPIASTPVGLVTSSSRAGYVEYPVARLSTSTVTSERYYKGIAIPGIGFWRLPNEDIFPAYTIKNISVGVGDGTTASFTNPLCYFKKGTDKVYKNGVQLTRDVDYTINNAGNSKCLPEISELTLPVTIRSDATSTTTLNDWVPLVLPTLQRVPGNGVRFLSNSNPLYIEYDEEVTFNCLACRGTWYAPSGTNGYNNVSSSVIFYLDYSIDGLTYEEVGQATNSTSFNIDFETKTAKYWRVRTSSTSTVGMRFTYDVPEAYMTLNLKDPYIVFTNAPAAGDVLTMDVDMDIIMKNSNFVVDVGAKLDFTW